MAPASADDLASAAWAGSRFLRSELSSSWLVNSDHFIALFLQFVYPSNRIPACLLEASRVRHSLRRVRADEFGYCIVNGDGFARGESQILALSSWMHENSPHKQIITSVLYCLRA